jgi:NhaP-type Na+/H+ and K+/H+ antiporter
VARFQARSAFTGVGFTTSESETIVGHPVRRRIVLLLMMVGNVGFVTIVASLILSFSSSSGTGDALSRLAVIVVAVGGLGYLTRTRLFERHITSLLARLLDRYSELDLHDFHHMMRIGGEYAVVELAVQEGDWLAGKTLAELHLPDEGVLVLALARADGLFLGAPQRATEVHTGDTVYLYGRSAVIASLDDRPDSPRGDLAHERAVAEQEQLLSDYPDD